MIYRYLRHPLLYYQIAGVALVIVIIVLILLGKYENRLSDAIVKQQNIRINMLKMGQAINDIELIIKKIDAVLPSEYNSKSHKELLLFALDDFKKIFKGSEITITRFEEKDGELSLPVSIKFPVEDYSIVVNRIGYLQSMKFPHFVIRHVGIDSVSEQKAKVATCKIEGLLKMPLAKLKDNKGKK